MLATILVMALAQDGGSLPQTCGVVQRAGGEVEGEVELYTLQPGRDASRRLTLELTDGGFCAPLEPGHWIARASGLAFDDEDPHSPQWSASSRFVAPAARALVLTVPHEAKRTFIVKDSWGRPATGKLAVFSATDGLTTLVWSAALDSRGRTGAALLADGDIEVRISHDQQLHVERRTLGPADTTVTLVVERPRTVSFRALAPDGSARDAVQVDGESADCISGLCRVKAAAVATSLLIEDGRSAAALVRLPTKPVDLTLPPVKLTANQEAMVKVSGKDGAVLDVIVEVQPVTRPGGWRVTRAGVTLPSGEREVVVRPAARRGGVFSQTRLAVKAGVIELALPTAGFLELAPGQGGELWVLPADPKLPATRVEPRRNTPFGPLLAGRYTLGGWSRGQALGPTEVDVEPGATTKVSLSSGPTARLTIRNERHDAQQPTQVVVVPKAGGTLPEALADPRAVTSTFGLGAEADNVTLAALPGPATIVALWQREHQPIRAVLVQTVLTEGANEVRLDDTLRQQNLGPLTEALAPLLASPFVTTIEP